MKMQFTPLPEHEELFSILKKHFAVVFGGYLRDVYAQVTPNDVDIVVEKNYCPSLLADLTSLGYVLYKQESDCIKMKGSLLPLDIMVAEEGDNHEALRLSPYAAPDFDINQLAYGFDFLTGGFNLYPWALDEHTEIKEYTGLSDEEIVTKIVENIRQRKAVLLDAEPDRVEKIKTKGYAIKQ